MAELLNWPIYQCFKVYVIITWKMAQINICNDNIAFVNQSTAELDVNALEFK